MANILVSLIIPAYNVENLISMTLESVANQTLKDFECIIVNDCSTDNTVEVVKEFLKKDKRFKLISHRANAGVSASRNTGLRFAKGKYVAFLDSDDLIMPTSLEKRAQTLDKSTDNRVLGTYSGSITISMDCKVPPSEQVAKLKTIDFITAAGNCPFNVNQPMFKTKLFKMFGGFDQMLKQAEDYNMWIRILRYGYKIIPTEMQLVTYRQTEGSLIRDNPLLHLDTSYKNFISCYQPYPRKSWNSKCGVVLKNGLDSYLIQLNIANRVLEFVGLGLSKGDSIDELTDRLLNYLPDYFDIIESHRAFTFQVKKGIDRYFKSTVDLQSQEFSVLNSTLKKLYKNFQKKSLKPIYDNEIIETSFSSNNIVSIPSVQEVIDLVFIPHKDYHVHAIHLIKPFLDKQGIKFIIVDISMHYRDERAVQACKQYELAYVGYSNFVLGNFKPKAIVVFNDWDPIVRSIVLAAKKTGIATIAIVEGIQDYLDADTKQNRKAYRTVEHVFLPGEHDKKYFIDSNQKLYVGGIPRIYDMYNKKENNICVEKKIALINSNFSYGVLEECRDEWLTLAVEGCIKAGFEPVITRHPADKGVLYPELVTKKSFYEALNECTLLISRFASGILEALAAGKMPIYFNPHGETVDKFLDSKLAYPLIFEVDALSSCLNNFDSEYSFHCSNFVNFLKFHCGDLNLNPSMKIADTTREILVESNKNLISYVEFFYYLSEIDARSGCFNNIKVLRELYSSEDIFFQMPQGFVEGEIDLKYCNSLLINKKYSEAKYAFSVLLSKNPDSPAYLSGYNTASQLKQLYLGHD